MRSMQEKILKQIEKLATARGLETIINKDYDNVLTVLFQPKNSFATALECHLSFQTNYLTGSLAARGAKTEILKTNYNDEQEMGAFFLLFHRKSGDPA